MGLQDADAADLAQDVFAVLVRKLPEFNHDPRRSFRGWLHTVLLNRWRDRTRHTPASLPNDVPAPDPIEEIHESEYRRHLVDRALRLMRSDFETTTWRACWGCVAEGRPAAEMAAELGLSVAAVYIARSRVLRRLRQELAGLIDP